MPLKIDEAARLFELQDQDNRFESLIESCYTSILTLGDEAVDGGAHRGMHTLPMARLVGSTGSVYAFEPIKNLADSLVYDTQDLPQVKTFQVALADFEGETTFHLMDDEPWLSGISRRFQQTDKTVTVLNIQTFVLDRLAERPIRFMKLDLEGGEYKALVGARNLLRRQRPTIALECGRAEAALLGGYTKDDYFGLFNHLDYQLHDLFGRLFSADDFARPWNDRFIPHYLIASPSEDKNMGSRLESAALKALAL